MTRTVHSPWQLAVFAARSDVPLNLRAYNLRAHLAGMPAGFRSAVDKMLSMLAGDQIALRERRN